MVVVASASAEPDFSVETAAVAAGSVSEDDQWPLCAGSVDSADSAAGVVSRSAESGPESADSADPADSLDSDDSAESDESEDSVASADSTASVSAVGSSDEPPDSVVARSAGEGEFGVI
jgi:hypothetical protein